MQLLATGHQRSSKTSRIEANGSPLAYASWEAAVESNDQETLNFESYNVAASNSFGEGVYGALDCAISFGGDWDANNPYVTDAPGLYPRDDLPELYFYTSRIDVVFWEFPYARLRSTKVGAQVKDKVSFDVSGHNQGPFDFPTGSA